MLNGVPCAVKIAARMGFDCSYVRTDLAMKAWRNALLLSLYWSSSSPDIIAVH